MIVVISPAKTLDFTVQNLSVDSSMPEFISEAKELMQSLKKLNEKDLIDLMGISHKLASLNYQRHLVWSAENPEQNARQALLVYKGEVYNGLKAETYSTDEFMFAQGHLRILNGLYGVLRPLDLIQEYRLEMETRLENKTGNSLYSFWGEKITGSINKAITVADSKTLVNLASNEYFKVINSGKIKGKIVTPVFKEEKGGNYKVVSIYSKKARGMMTSFIIKNRICDPEDLVSFNEEGYAFNSALSSDTEIVFTR